MILRHRVRHFVAVRRDAFGSRNVNERVIADFVRGPGHIAVHKRPMKFSTPFDKVQVIERSLHCFTCGLLGLLPLVGLPFAIMALFDSFRITTRKANIWNPADRYLSVGTFCAALGLILNCLGVGIILVEVS